MRRRSIVSIVVPPDPSVHFYHWNRRRRTVTAFPFGSHVALLCRVLKSTTLSSSSSCKAMTLTQSQLRWDKADSGSYYSYTGDHFQPMRAILENLKKEYQDGGVSTENVHCCIESTYRSIVSVLYSDASVSWSKRVKKFEAKFHDCNNLLNLLCKLTYR